jgi:filamentous hemagglutinin family protein
MQSNFLRFFFLIPIVASLFLSKANAQIIPDNSLGTENSIVSPNTQIEGNPATLVEGGAIRNTNLFHSFQEFSIPTDDRIYFANPDGIQNIFTRVTGNNISEIMGTLGVNGNANLFFMNPNGIIFGKDARLDLNGSFFATTATSLVWEEGLEFSANKPETAPLLTINRPIGLQMGNNSGSITVQGEGHLVTGSFIFSSVYNDTDSGLQVNQGQTLGLIGGEINLTGGILRVPGGNIQLVGAREGVVKLENNGQIWQTDTTNVREFANITLDNLALVDTGGIITGDIQLYGKNIALQNGSAILIQNLGDRASGGVIINATDSITITDAVRNNPDTITPLGNRTGVVPSKIFTESLGTGKAGDIFISGGNLSITSGGTVNARSFSSADTGSININIDDSINLDGYSPLNPAIISSININSFNSGDSGELNVFAQNVSITNGGSLVSSNFSSGKGSEIEINVTGNLVVSGFDREIASPSAVGNTSTRTGNSGNLTINVANLSIFNGGVIGTSTLAQGSGGQLTINASQSIEISGTKPELRLVSAIRSGAPVYNAILRQFLGVPDRPSGDSGSVIVNSPILIVTDGAEVGVSNQGLGNSGSLQINADQIFLDTKGNINAFSASGQGGNIELNLGDSLLLRNGSFISAEAMGTLNAQTMVNGGNIDIDTPLITLLENSKINANSLAGNGGNIQIDTQGLFTFGDESISASSQLGLDGEIEIKIIQDDRNLGLIKLTETSLDRNEEITIGCNANNSLAIVNRDGLPKDPTDFLEYNNLWTDLRSYPNTKYRRNIVSLAPSQKVEMPLIEARSWQINDRGNVELLAENNPQNLQQQAIDCPVN